MNTENVVYPRPRIRMRVPANSNPAELDPAARVTAEAAGKSKKRKANKGSFPPRVSGNPNGRPPGAKGAKAQVKKALSVQVETRTSKGTKKVSIFLALVNKEIALAADGDWRARKTVFELAKWALSDVIEPGDRPHIDARSEELTETGRAILDWFAEELREQDRNTGGLS